MSNDLQKEFVCKYKLGRWWGKTAFFCAWNHSSSLGRERGQSICETCSLCATNICTYRSRDETRAHRVLQLCYSSSVPSMRKQFLELSMLVNLIYRYDLLTIAVITCPLYRTSFRNLESTITMLSIVYSVWWHVNKLAWCNGRLRTSHWHFYIVTFMAELGIRYIQMTNSSHTIYYTVFYGKRYWHPSYNSWQFMYSYWQPS